MLETLTSVYVNTDPDEHGILRGGVCHRPQGHGVNELLYLVRQDG